jgi:hypothetical protein
MTESYPVPPPELVGQWLCSDDYPWGPLEQSSITITTNRLQNVATQAAQWGADQELEACCRWLAVESIEASQDLRTTRRPKPPSLKEQAQAELDRLVALIPTEGALAIAEPIRRALEALDD